MYLKCRHLVGFHIEPGVPALIQRPIVRLLEPDVGEKGKKKKKRKKES